MLEGIKRSWRQLKAGEPGHRFQSQYEAQKKSRRPGWVRPVWLAAGTVIMAVGVVALAYPLWATLAAEDQDGQQYASVLIPIAVAAWLMSGVGFYIYLRVRTPQKLALIGSAFAKEPSRD